MPVYESKEITKEKLEQIRKRSRCSECGEWLNTYLDHETHNTFIACKDWLRTHHEGIAKESREPRELNIPTKIKEMEEEMGTEKANQRIKYQGVTSLTRPQAMEIMETIWPDAPMPDKVAAAILCSSYGLNPLANHVFLIPFKDHDTGETTWARVWGIKAKRLLGSRKGGYSYLDMTPRLMTEAEQVKVWGAVDTANLCYITWLKDMKTGAEVYGYGKWPKGKSVKGADKGNSQANMASIRSESQALDRLRPAEMPTGWTATDEQYLDVPYVGKVEVATGEIIEGESREVEVEPEPSPEATEATTKPPETTSDGKPVTTAILLAWVTEAKAFGTHKTARAWLVNYCKIDDKRIDSEPEKVYDEIKDKVK